MIFDISTLLAKHSQRSPHDGAKLVSVLRRLLAREARFVAWKNLSCPEIEISRPVLTEEGACAAVCCAECLAAVRRRSVFCRSFNLGETK
jgi:hypothetical protein